jgi:hypothetical protein
LLRVRWWWRGPPRSRRWGSGGAGGGDVVRSDHVRGRGALFSACVFIGRFRTVNATIHTNSDVISIISSLFRIIRALTCRPLPPLHHVCRVPFQPPCVDPTSFKSLIFSLSDACHILTLHSSRYIYFFLFISYVCNFFLFSQVVCNVFFFHKLCA